MPDVINGDMPIEPASAEAEESPRPGGWRVVLPAGAFLGGFLWDAFTLGRQIKSSDLLILAAYLAAAAAILVLMGRQVAFRGSSKLNLALQFLFGGIFSALVVLYFLSSGGAKSFVVVGGLAAMLVTNEFLGERYRRLSVSWAVFGACGIMLLNFLLPHLMRSIHPAWFYVSLVLAVSLVVLLQRLSRTEEAVVWPTLVVAALLAILHLSNLIPPVPLVPRAMVVATQVTRDGEAYVLRGRRGRDTLLGPPELIRGAGDPVVCFTSIFVPRGIQTDVTHRWLRLDPGTGDWKQTDAVTFTIKGGRRGGYRGYSLKKNASDGDWLVQAETASGALIASTRFRVSSDSSRRTKDFERRF